jgi:hypothetical protein
MSFYFFTPEQKRIFEHQPDIYRPSLIEFAKLKYMPYGKR